MMTAGAAGFEHLELGGLGMVGGEGNSVDFSLYKKKGWTILGRYVPNLPLTDFGMS
jgi:hypothetical protein